LKRRNFAPWESEEKKADEEQRKAQWEIQRERNRQIFQKERDNREKRKEKAAQLLAQNAPKIRLTFFLLFFFIIFFFRIRDVSGNNKENKPLIKFLAPQLLQDSKGNTTKSSSNSSINVADKNTHYAIVESIVNPTRYKLFIPDSNVIISFRLDGLNSYSGDDGFYIIVYNLELILFP
jgi:hypothetical protein